MPFDLDDDRDRFDEEYQAVPKGVWAKMKRAAKGDLRRTRQKRGDVARDERIARRREQDHRRGHGKHERGRDEPDGKRKREL